MPLILFDLQSMVCKSSKCLSRISDMVHPSFECHLYDRLERG